MSLSEVVLQTRGLISDSQKERDREQAWNEEMFDLCIQSRKSSSIAKLRVESEPYASESSQACLVSHFLFLFVFPNFPLLGKYIYAFYIFDVKATF
jgi:hypothetical protein